MNVIFHNKSLIHAKKNRRPKIDPCGKSAFTGSKVANLMTVHSVLYAEICY